MLFRSVVDGRGPVPVGVSVGVASLGAAVRTPTELVGAADGRMYAAKIANHAHEFDRLAEIVAPPA